MEERGADEVVLETEESNVPAMKLYERLGFLRSKKLHRYYLNGSSAYRLVLHLKGVGEMMGAVEERERFGAQGAERGIEAGGEVAGVI